MKTTYTKPQSKTITCLLLLMAILLLPVAANSQITIGMDTAPTAGALLQLKSTGTTADNTNSDKGLGLPRVKLNESATGTNDGMKLLSTLGITGIIFTDADAKEHAGVIVFNVTTASGIDITNYPYAEAAICPGVYVWLGDRWARAMTKACL